MKNKILDFLKREVVLIIALLLGMIGLILARPGFKEVLSFIDFRVLAILLALMIVMEGFKSTGVFAFFAKKLIGKCKTTRGISLVLVFLCFFSSMLITNDVALITFVPFAIETLKIAEKKDKLIPIVVFQTLAANLGSMLTPLGNPQNLYLFNLMDCSLVEFIRVILPYSILAGLLIFFFLLLGKKEPVAVGELLSTGIEAEDERDTDLKHGNKLSKNTMKNIVFAVLFVLCLLSVLKLVDYYVMLPIVLVLFLIVDRKSIVRADYSLLFTFIGFFLFIGSIGKIEEVHNWLGSVVGSREMLIGVASSQIISNVPAAILLSGFAGDLRELLIGVNLGGLGTLIASMASLISYKQIVNECPEKKGRYFRLFTLANIVFLILEVGLYFALKMIFVM